MGIFFAYILKVAICLVLFYLFYKLLLSRETFHRFNRMVLLSLLSLSLLLPLVQVTTTEQTEVHRTVLTVEQLLMMAGQTPGVAVTQAEEATISWIQLALLLYLVGIVFFAFRHLYTLTRLLLLVRSGRREKMAHGVWMIVHRKNIAPFSWMKYVVIAEKDLEENGREILIHEMAHVHNRHSVDLLVADICIFFQWFNPASWLLKQELQNIHEYEADETVIKKGVDAKQYQLLLIKKAVGTRLYSMANSFNHSKLKKRITMMLKEKSSPWARLKYLYVLPLAAIAVTAFARPEISNKMEEISAVKVNDLAAIVETKVQETVPVAVKDTVKKQTVTVEKTVTGKVNVVGWKNFGEVSEAQSGEKTDVNVEVSFSNSSSASENKPMFIVDGLEASPNVLSALSPDRIESITVLKDASSIAIYGDKGKNGVIIITLKTEEEYQESLKRRNSDEKASDRVKISSVRSVGVADGLDKKKITYYINGVKTSPESVKVLEDNDAYNISTVSVSKSKEGTGVINIITKKEYGGERIKDELKVVGKVLDKDKKPIVGAAVIIKGTTTGTIVDMDGNFVIMTPKDAILQISYIGMQTAEVKVASSPLTVMLKDEK